MHDIQTVYKIQFFALLGCYTAQIGN